MRALLFSSLLFLLPFFYPCVSPLFFFFLIPIFYQLYSRPLLFKEGFTWGIATFSIHLIWFFCLIFDRGSGALRITLYFLTVMWFSAWSGVWFCLIFKLKFILKKYFNDQTALIFALLCPTMLFFWFVVRASLFLCGAFEGYIFFNPFIPLSYYPQLSWFLYYLNFIGGLFCLILFQTTLLLGYLKSKKYLLVSLLAVAPFLFGFYFYNPIQIDTNEFQFIKPWWCTSDRSKDPIFCGYRMVHDVSQASLQNNNTKTIVMPESAFGWNLYEYEQFIGMLCEGHDDQIVLGAQRKINGRMFNSCFVLQDSKVQYIYDKQHLMPFVERMPYLFDLVGCSEIFTSKQDVFSYPLEEQNDTIDLRGQVFQLFLCSELFLETKEIKGIAILFLCNDSWFSCFYGKQLSQLFLNYISSIYQVPIVFCTVEGIANI